MAGFDWSAFARIGAAIRRALDAIAPSAETIARRQALAFRTAYCGLLMEVARLESPRPDLKQAAVEQAVKETFAPDDTELAALTAGSSTNAYVSYYEPIALVNRHCSAQQRVQFVEQLWHVAYADGAIDMYEDQLVRKLSDLLYVAHADFILAKHRVCNPGGLNAAASCRQ
jgi:uncharacterized tellurite resistance protein B-like protein